MIDPKDINYLSLQWRDPMRGSLLCGAYAQEYFSTPSNPFYDKTCNNEICKMQNRDLEFMKNMTGIEYILLHVQEPILYIIRKQNRHSPTSATPLADYYILAGHIYQCPDLQSVINSRLANASYHIQSAFEEMSRYMRYHPNKGYSWEFSKGEITEEENKDKPEVEKHNRYTDLLLMGLDRRFQLTNKPKDNPNQDPKESSPEDKKDETEKQANVKTEPGMNTKK